MKPTLSFDQLQSDLARPVPTTLSALNSEYEKAHTKVMMFDLYAPNLAFRLR